MTLGSLWAHFWVTFVSPVDHFVFTSSSLWVHFGVTLGHCGITLGSRWDHFGVTLGSLWDLFGISKRQKNDPRAQTPNMFPFSKL